MPARKKPVTLAEFARMGGNARAAKLSAERRSEIARAAARKRWTKPTPTAPEPER